MSVQQTGKRSVNREVLASALAARVDNCTPDPLQRAQCVQVAVAIATLRQEGETAVFG